MSLQTGDPHSPNADEYNLMLRLDDLESLREEIAEMQEGEAARGSDVADLLREHRLETVAELEAAIRSLHEQLETD